MIQPPFKAHARYNTPLPVTVFASKTQTLAIKAVAKPWSKIVELHQKLSVREAKDGLMVGGYKLDGARSNANVAYRTFVQLDIDSEVTKDKVTGNILRVIRAAPTLEKLAEKLQRYEWLAHSTHSHDPKRGIHKYRVVLLPDRDILSHEYPPLLEALDELLDGVLDRNAWAWSQPFYLRSTSEANKSTAFFLHNKGNPLPVDEFVRRGQQILKSKSAIKVSGSNASELLEPNLVEPETHERIGQIKTALSKIDPDTGYIEWRNACWAVISTGWACARQLVQEWSMKGAKYDESAFDRVVRDFDPQGGISLASLFYIANKYGGHGLSDQLASSDSEWPDVDRNGKVRATLRNTKLAIQRLGIECSHDQFRQRKMIQSHTLQEYQGELTDDRCAALRNIILERWGFDPGRDHTRDAIDALCLASPFHPIRKYLDSLVWDGVPRLTLWLSHYLGAPVTQLNSAIGKIVLTAAVRRVRQPGAKFDNILVLEGDQGTGKSTALTILAGSEFFSDCDLLALDSKAQMEALEGIWIYELAEFKGLHRADVDHVKAFASRTTDRSRAAYARFREDKPRQCIFIGTVNGDKYLTDPTGNRRWWPVKTGKIDLAGLLADRDQLWAEAAQLESAGTSLVLAKGLWGEAAEEQDARLEEDPWLDILATIPQSRFAEKVGDEMRVKSSILLAELLEIPRPQQHQKHAKRLADIMRKLGWEGPTQLKFGTENVRGYRRPLAMDGKVTRQQVSLGESNSFDVQNPRM